MPPKVRFTKEAIAKAALNVARQRGGEAVNARAIARELGCSTQPLFREFQTMEQIRREVTELAQGVYREYVLRGMATAEKPYKAAGMAYLHFAMEEPQLFKLLFMCDRAGGEAHFGEDDDTLDAVLKPLMESTGLTQAQARMFHLHSWIFVHGMASMIATGYIRFTEEQLSGLVSECFLATRLLFEQNAAK